MTLAPLPLPPTISWPLGLDHSITVRPLLPGDADLEVEFVRGLSPDSLYNRVFTRHPAMTQEWLDRLTRIDFTRDMAIIATVAIDDRESQIGVARYVRLEDVTRCEFAITLADPWQGLGLGGRLLRELVAIAQRSGITEMVGDVLATNTAMLKLARRAGMRIEPHPDGATLRRVVMPLPAAAPASPPAPTAEAAA